MIYLLYGLFLLTCIVLVLAVLLQPGKADAGALFTSSISSTAFGPRGTQTLLAKITIAAAATFMLLSLTLSLPGVTGSRSVVESDADAAAPVQQQEQQPQGQQPQAAPSAAAQPAAAEQQPNASPTAATGNTNSPAPAQSAPASNSNR